MNDICENKHGGTFTSKAAFKRAQPNMSKSRQDVLFAVEMSLDIGITAKEYAQKNGVQLNTISGRFTELAREGWIMRTDETRDGCGVWKAID
jgi:hypothetical protein